MHECLQVSQPQILYLMNENFAVHAEFEFGGLLFSVGVSKKQRVQSAAKRRPASFLPKVPREKRRKLNDSVLKVFCSFLNKLGGDASRSGANAFHCRSQGLGRNSGKVHSASARTCRSCTADLVSGSHCFLRPTRRVLQL